MKTTDINAGRQATRAFDVVDIARHLKLSPGSVERYIARATQHVRERVRDDD